MKKTDQFLFRTKLRWQGDSHGLLSSNSTLKPIEVATPKIFKGTNVGMWSPEELLLGALSSCIMTTFFFHAKKANVMVTDFDCEVIGTIQLIDTLPVFTEINVYPSITVVNETYFDNCMLAFKKTTEHCLVSKAISTPIYYHPVFVDNK